MDELTLLSKQCSLPFLKVQAVAGLLDQGATIPFIARYRKEKTGSMDEVAIARVRDGLEAIRALEKRKTAILSSLELRDLLTPELKISIDSASTSAELEDRYLKYRPKKRSRAMAAREKGLAPLADRILSDAECFPETAAKPFINPSAGILTAKDALDGARDILAEIISDDPSARESLRQLFSARAAITTHEKKDAQAADSKYRDYVNLEESVSTIPSHRFLAVMRAAAESILTVRALPPEHEAIALLEALYVKRGSRTAPEMIKAVRDSYQRLLKPSLENETLAALKQSADQTAIQIFTGNLQELLLSPPLGQKRILAIDPGFRTGCKIVCLDAQGNLTDWTTIFPHTRDPREAGNSIRDLVHEHEIEAIAIGNGTAGRETEQFVRELDLPGSVLIVMVDESGASVYSASPEAREEFPDHDITVRGAVSIGRRLMDPLAELVKIDPKAIGVGQYQHDVDQKQLKKALDDTVTLCVNRVGVEINTASAALLSRISGLNTSLASAIIRHRSTNGPFRSRQELLRVPRFGPKAFEQSAGFLRIRNSQCPLDNTGIHPESYPLVFRMADDAGVSLDQLMTNPGVIDRLPLTAYVCENTGMETLEDIRADLSRPGRDPREPFSAFSFDREIHDITDLRQGMRIPGIVTNVTAFGAFVNIGVHQDGLVHISQMSDRFVRNPNDVVKARQQVMVTVLSIDVDRKRISLSMKTSPGPSQQATSPS